MKAVLNSLKCFSSNAFDLASQKSLDRVFLSKLLLTERSYFYEEPSTVNKSIFC